MKRLGVLSLAFLGAFSLGIPSTAPAQVPLLGNNLGVHLGYAKARDAEDGNFLVGGHLEFMLAGFLGIRGAVDYRTVESFPYSYGSVDGEFGIKSIPVTAEGRLYVPGTSVSPYLAAGAGWYFLNYDFSEDLEAIGFGDDWDSEFGWHIGAGAVVGIAPTLSLFGEAKAIFLDPNRAIDDETVDAVLDFEYQSTYFAAGLSIKF